MRPGRAPNKIAPNKKVGSRPLDRATYLEAYQYKFPIPKTQDHPWDSDSLPLSRGGRFPRTRKKKASPEKPERPFQSAVRIDD